MLAYNIISSFTTGEKAGHGTFAAILYLAGLVRLFPGTARI
jgi:hypothetical protein